MRRELPSGVRFETTHALPPQNRLLFSSRFTKKGYFLSNAAEDGYRAVLQDHPYVVPMLVALAGLIICLAIGVFVWPRAPSSSQSTAETLENFGRRFRREVAATYGFAIVMFVLAIVPMLNFTYSGMGDRVGSWRRSVFHGRSSECCTSSEWARPSLALGTRAFARLRFLPTLQSRYRFRWPHLPRSTRPSAWKCQPGASMHSWSLPRLGGTSRSISGTHRCLPPRMLAGASPSAAASCSSLHFIHTALPSPRGAKARATIRNAGSKSGSIRADQAKITALRRGLPNTESIA